MKIQISPSVLACDFSRLGEETLSVEKAGAEMLHLDVMDGEFVPNISFGMPVIASLRKTSDMVFDVHLMIDRPERYIKRFAEAGSDVITFHYEATADPAAVLREIKSLGKRASISVKPATPVEVLYPLLPLCDMVLIMTVEPGFGGQGLIPETIEKVRKIRAEIEKQGLSVDVEVDGGIAKDTAPLAVAAGANVLVAGSAVFKAQDRKAAIDILCG